MEKIVAVTGASGYIGQVLVKFLTEKGYKVHATVRDLKKEYSHLRSFPGVTLFEADLLSPNSFDEAFEGVDCVFHVAAVVPLGKKKDPIKEIVDPAIKGMENTFKSALKGKVPFFVATSSGAAVRTVGVSEGVLLNESNWNSDHDPNKTPYCHSKVMSEKLVWKLAEENKDKIKVATICPAMVLGPFIGKTEGTSVSLMKSFLNGKMAEQGSIIKAVNLCDVRDVANAHIQAYEQKRNERFIVSSRLATGTSEWVKLLKDKFPNIKYPDRFASVEKIRFDLPMEYDSSKAIALLKMNSLTPLKKTLEDMIEHMIKVGIIEK